MWRGERDGNGEVLRRRDIVENEKEEKGLGFIVENLGKLKIGPKGFMGL